MTSLPLKTSLFDRVLDAQRKLRLIQAAAFSEDENDPYLMFAIGDAAKEAIALLEPVREAIALAGEPLTPRPRVTKGGR